jgi:hypothetical protein
MPSSAQTSRLHIVGALDFGTSNSAMAFKILDLDNIATAKVSVKSWKIINVNCILEVGNRCR